MNKRIHNAYDAIHADERLLAETKTRLDAIRSEQLSQNHHRTSVIPGREGSLGAAAARFGRVKGVRIAAAFCLMLVLLVSTGTYTLTASAASHISIDAEPSIELTCNRLGKVIDATAYNDSGKEVLKTVDVKGCTYEDAVDVILQSDKMNEYLTESPKVKISVLSASSSRCSTIIRKLSSCAEAVSHQASICESNSDCYEEAHDHNMSFGKYETYQKLSACDDSYTTDDCEDMSVGEMEECIEDCDHSGSHSESHSDSHSDSLSEDHASDHSDSSSESHESSFTGSHSGSSTGSSSETHESESSHESSNHGGSGHDD